MPGSWGGAWSQEGSALGGAWSGGGAGPRGVSAPGGWFLVSKHALRQTPTQERWPLLRTVRILLECILVANIFGHLFN